MVLTNSKKYLKRAKNIIPGLSQTFSKAPYSYVEGTYPVFIKKGNGCKLTDVDDNEFIDYVLALGPVSLGYCYKKVDNAIKQQLEKGISFSMPHYLEVEFSEKLQKIIPNAEMVRFSKTGSDAVTACLRVARAYTKKDHILYCGHGGVWHDWFTTITSRNQGIPKFNSKLISLFQYNNLESVKKLFKTYHNKVAAVIMEPMWLDFPNESFLHELKELAHKNNALFIFDEVLTGFRLANGGGQELLKIDADLAAFGKAIGNGMPLGAITGKEEYMKEFNDVFYSTTYAGEALSLAAGNAVVDEYLNKPVIKHCWKMGQLLKDNFNKISSELKLNAKWNGLPVRGSIEFLNEKGNDKNSLKSLFLQECIKNNILLGQGEALLSYSHKIKDIKSTITTFEKSLQTVSDAIQKNNVSEKLEGKEIKSVMTF
tara:strand:+ start:168 stop:1448 length:1281 start_codon:yes stop_codon:yes gene_type:complete